MQNVNKQIMISYLSQTQQSLDELFATFSSKRKSQLTTLLPIPTIIDYLPISEKEKQKSQASNYAYELLDLTVYTPVQSYVNR